MKRYKPLIKVEEFKSQLYINYTDENERSICLSWHIYNAQSIKCVNNSTLSKCCKILEQLWTLIHELQSLGYKGVMKKNFTSPHLWTYQLL